MRDPAVTYSAYDNGNAIVNVVPSGTAVGSVSKSVEKLKTMG
jgi:hypothetical protein